MTDSSEDNPSFSQSRRPLLIAAISGGLLLLVFLYLAAPRRPSPGVLQERGAMSVLLAVTEPADYLRTAPKEGPFQAVHVRKGIDILRGWWSRQKKDPGYWFDLSGSDQEYQLRARPKDDGAGSRTFYIDETGVLRASTDPEKPAGPESPALRFHENDVDPIFIRIEPFLLTGVWKKPLEIRYYGLFFVLAIYMGWWMLSQFCRRIGEDPLEADRITLYVVLGILVGARFFHLVFYHPERLLDDPTVFIRIWEGGLASHGAAVGAIVGSWLFAWRNDWSWRRLSDMLIVPISLATAFIRAGNFMNSEIVGRTTEGALGTVFFRYQDPNRIWLSQAPRHPSQLYEIGIGLVVFAILYTFWRRRRRHARGFIIASFMVLYFTARFSVEFFKYVNSDLLAGGFWEVAGIPISMGQLLSLPFILGALPFWFIYFRPDEEERRAIEKEEEKAAALEEELEEESTEETEDGDEE